ncbi:MAG: hypothetical protein IANPNBLG_02296 [Bryobacteraceae bacterium]|nr:hypothetical protein [Bryobacteraceae bacterium]
MGRSEDGEFELILGNKQLLSVFFIVVVLLGVFFTMGYIVGKNSVPPEIARREPIVVDPNAAPNKEPSPEPAAEPKQQPPEERKTPAVETPSRPEPVKPVEKPTEPRPEAKKESPKPPPPVEHPAETPPPPRKPALSTTGEPGPGQQFLQVVASTRPDCEIIVDVLKRKGFQAIIVPIPNGTLYRVLVGPLSDAASVNKTRADLEAAGFQKPYLRKY